MPQMFVQSSGSQTQPTRYPNIVADFGRITPQGTPCRNFTYYRYIKDQIAFGGIATNQHRIKTRGQSKKAIAKTFEPVLIQFRQGSTEQHPTRLGTHSGHIG